MGSSGVIRVLFAGGGTGGHLYPAIALAQEFEKRMKTEIMFIGTSYGIESKVLPQTSYIFKKIWMRGLQRKISFSNLMFPLRLLVSLLQCAFYLLRFRPHVVVGTGGYVSGPALMMGLAFGIPTVIQEQNSYPGLVNRVLGNRVNQVHLTYEASESHFKKQKNVFVSGNPSRGEISKLDKTAALKKFQLNMNKTTLLIFGGSQGAYAINRQVLESLESLMKLKDLQILWASGAKDLSDIKTRCEKFQERVRALAFIEDMGAAYAAADLVLCRAGASALAEIAICGLPAILIPYPYAAAGHQEFNARTMEQVGAAIMILEKNLNAETLTQTVAELLDDPQKRTAMSAAALKLARPHAARDIMDKIATLIQ
ncbi:MAG: undecaprenyldiphospho-muramoylpentapeptide beta-N-acetylglucosaminyltransferase [bacterium]